jgi:hypothetical protein
MGGSKKEERQMKFRNLGIKELSDEGIEYVKEFGNS